MQTMTTAAEVIELRKRVRQLEELVRTDELTGALNLRGINEAMTHEMARSKRDGTPLCVVILDLDNFKSFNDERGHAAGDGLLQWSVRQWRREIRDMDYIGRRGGDEFAVLLPECGIDKAREVAERLSTRTLRRASAGVALWTPGEKAADVWDRADLAMYEAKRAGREPRRQSERATASREEQ